MTLPSFQVEVYHPTSGDLIHVFDARSFHELRYERLLNGIGKLVMVLPATPGLPELFPLDALIEVRRTSPSTGRLITEDTYFARMPHHFREGNDERFLIGGVSLNHLLARRVIDPADDPLAAGGFSTKSGAADSVLREYALEQCGASASTLRQFPDFAVATVSGTGLSVGRRLRYENLLDVFQEITEQSDVDFIISRTSGRATELTIATIGTDKTKESNYPFGPFVYLTPTRGNMANPSLLIDRREEKNFVYALAQGAGENRIVQQLQGNGVTDSPFNRIEFAEDVRTAERGNPLEILTQARKKLDDNQKKIEFTFELTGDQPGNTYRNDWDIGDKITAAWDGIEQDLRIRAVEITVNADGERIQVVTDIL